MTRVNYKTLGQFIDIDEKDLEFERVTNSIDVVDREYGVEVIFDYYRRHGFPHCTIREEEKQQIRELQRKARGQRVSLMEKRDELLKMQLMQFLR